MLRRVARRGSWLADITRRAHAISTTRAVYPTLTYRRRHANGPWHIFTAELPLPGYESRRVSVEFEEDLPAMPRVFADGPTASPHRFADRRRTRLCIWYPTDPPEQRWVPDDGLVALLGMAQHHLFKESWWRETGEWLGDEAPHDAALDETEDP